MTDFALERPLDIGEALSQSEVGDVFDTNFGYQFRGITLRSPPGGRYVILLANDGALYDDAIGDSDRFTYLGEGVPEKGDQSDTAANTALIEAIHDQIPIYLFTSEDGADEYEYRGIVTVEGYCYETDGDRMVYRFEMEQQGVASWEQYDGE